MYFENGMTKDDWDAIVQAKQVDRLRLSQIEDKVSGAYLVGLSPCELQETFDFAFPCATQNEIDEESVKQMVGNGLKGLFEGANLPTQLEAQEVLKENPQIIYIPGKAANAGGVGVSGFEMTQNAQKMRWKPEVVDEKLKELMADIYSQLTNAAGNDGSLESGANLAGFSKIVDAMEDLGWL
jgi:glutamate dehydrogenase (NADP+)